MVHVSAKDIVFEEDGQRIKCPFCSEMTHVGNAKLRDIISEPVETVDHHTGKKVTQVDVNTQHHCCCDKCKNDFIIECGRSVYNVYKTPLPLAKPGEAWLLAKFESPVYKSFSIYKAVTPDKADSCLYYVLADGFDRPIFLSQKDAIAYLSDIMRAMSSINSIWFTWYR